MATILSFKAADRGLQSSSKNGRSFAGCDIVLFPGVRYEYQAAPAEAKKAITFGESKPDPALNEPELAAWSLVTNLILNLDEAVVRN